jgi:hypothetical protein
MSLGTYERSKFVDENQTRIYAMLVVLLMSVYMITKNITILYVLAYDIFACIYLSSLLSPLCMSSLILSNIFSFKKKLTDISAKEFASHIGLSILFIAIFVELLGYSNLSLSLVLFFTIWKLLEATFEFLKKKNIELESL